MGSGHKNTQGHHSSPEGAYLHHQKDGPERLWSYAPPWLIWLAILGVAYVGRWLWPASPWFALFAEASVILWCWVAWRMTRTLHEVLRLLALMTIGIIGVFLILGNILGMNAAMVSLWGGIGFSFNVAWTIRRMLMPEWLRGQRQVNPMAAKLLETLGGAQLGTPKQKVIEGLG